MQDGKWRGRGTALVVLASLLGFAPVGCEPGGGSDQVGCACPDGDAAVAPEAEVRAGTGDGAEADGRQGEADAARTDGPRPETDDSGTGDGVLRRPEAGAQDAAHADGAPAPDSGNGTDAPLDGPPDWTGRDAGAPDPGRAEAGLDDACQRACGGRQCGPDGCGGECGTCPIYTTCNPAGLCDVAAPACGDGTCVPFVEDCLDCPDDCGPCTGACCEAHPGGGCEDEALARCVCAVDPFCCAWRWDGLCAGEVAGLGCGSCPCRADCFGRRCGDDGCGGSCGECPAGFACDRGLCLVPVCVPDCAGRLCGDDGCGGSCGACDDGLFCTRDSCGAGTCTHTIEPYFCAVGDRCVPDGFDNPAEPCEQCVANEAPAAWSPKPDGTECGVNSRCYGGRCCDPVANCTGRACGDDGCGGECGTCDGELACVDGQCTTVTGCPFETLGAFGGDGLDVLVRGDYAYALVGWGLYVFTLARPEAPELVRIVPLPGLGVVLTSTGALALVGIETSDTRYAVVVCDLSDPAEPVVRGSLPVPASVADLRLAAGIGYVAAREAGLQILDVSDPDTPVWLGGIDTVGLAEGVDVAAGRAYVADGWAGVVVVDVSDPTAPVEGVRYDTPGEALDVIVADGLAYVADGLAGGLQVFDVQDPGQWTLLATVAPEELGGITRLALADARLHAIGRAAAPATFDISTPTAPTLLARVEGEGLALAAAGGLVYAIELNTRGRLAVWDPEAPDGPVERGSAEWPRGFQSVFAAGGGVVLFDGARALAVDPSDPRLPRVVAEAPCPVPVPPSRSVPIRDGRFVASVESPGDGPTLYVIALDPAAPPMVRFSYALPGQTGQRRLAVEGETVAIVSAEGLGGRSGTLLLFRLTATGPEPTFALQPLLSRALPEGAHGVALQDGVVFVALRTSQLWMLDVQDPQNPPPEVLWGDFGHNGGVFDVAVSGTLAFLAVRNGLEVVDVANLAHPARLSEFALGPANDVELAGDQAFLTNPSVGLYALDVANPANPVLVGVTVGLRNVEDLVVTADRLYVLHQQALRILDRPSCP